LAEKAILKAVLGLEFLKVTVLGAVVVFTVTVPNAKLVGEAVSGANPVPDRPSRSGEPMAGYATVTSPETAPSTVGL
jgi:hypothetical protein